MEGRAREAGAKSRYMFCIVTGRGLRHGVVCETMSNTAEEACDTTSSSARGCMATQPATRPGARCDTAEPGLRHGAVRAQCARRLGQGWVHCSESLFMSTVHEVFKKK